MFKKKLKLSLIEDYIRIVTIENFYNNSFELFNLSEDLINDINKTKLLNANLKSTYETIFETLNLNDISLLILKKELKQNNALYKKVVNKSFLNFLEVCNRNNLELTMIELNLKRKLKELKILNIVQPCQ